jgi:TolB-like protein
MKDVIRELSRRHVLRVAVAYFAISWVVIQVVNIVEGPLQLPIWTDTLIIILLAAGLPIALLVAWAFELTPDGIKRTEDLTKDATQMPVSMVDYVMLTTLILAIGFAAWGRLAPTSEQNAAANQARPSEANRSVAPVSAAHGKRTIVILPFVNMSKDPGQEYFSDGISEELIKRLTRIEGLRVTSRTSAFAFKASGLSLPEIAAQLGVKFVLEGSVRRDGDQLRIDTQLVNVDTDSSLWTGAYERELGNIFAIQDDIAVHVAGALEVALLGADGQATANTLTTSIEVYTDYLLARDKFSSFQFEPMAEAEMLLKRAIASDPDFAPAYGALVELYRRMTDIGMLSPEKADEKITPFLNRALSLKHRNPQIWLARSDHLILQGKLDEATEARRLARALGPNDSAVLWDRIMQASAVRQPDDMTPYIDTLLSVDPLSAFNYVIVLFWYSRQDQADLMQVAKTRMMTVSPDNPFGYFSTLVTPMRNENNSSKIVSGRNGMRAEASDPEMSAFLALYLMDAGEISEVESLVHQARSLDENHILPIVVQALYLVYMGESKKAEELCWALARSGATSRWGLLEMALRVLASRAIETGEIAELIQVYEAVYPGLKDANLARPFATPPRYAKRGQLIAALDLAALYQKTGNSEKAGDLLDAVEQEIPFWPRRGVYGIGFADAELLAIRGDDAAALARLRQAHDEGLTSSWWWFLDHSPHFAGLREKVEFKTLRSDFAALAAFSANTHSSTQAE